MDPFETASARASNQKTEDETCCQSLCRHKRIMATIMIHFLAIGCVICAMFENDLSEVTWDFSGKSHFDKIYYDCGWQELHVYYYYTTGASKEARYTYTGNICDTNAYNIFTHTFCDTMLDIGTTWVVINIVVSFIILLNTILIFKQNKSIRWNIAYCIVNFICIFCLSLAIGYWFDKEKCKDIEVQISSNYVIRSIIGSSMILDFAAIGLLLMALLLAFIHLSKQRADKKGYKDWQQLR